MPQLLQEQDSVESGENPDRFKPFLVVAVVSTLAVVFFFFRDPGGGRWFMELGFVISAATLIAIAIWQACDPFADAAQWVGRKLDIPKSVRGATLDAVASSMPELFTGIFFVTVALTGDATSVEHLKAELAEGYGSTIATCAGSSIYNMVLIPAICAIAISYSRPNRAVIDIAPEVIRRDGMWVMATQLGLLVFLFQPRLDWWMAVVALCAYVGYVLHLYLATRQFRSQRANRDQLDEEPRETARLLFETCEIRLNRWTSLVVLSVSTIIAAGACYLLVGLTNDAATKLGVPAFFVAVILTAAVSSIPDTFVSLGSAKRGDDAGAISNVFGSNIFDICIGMSIPLIVSCYLNDWQPVSLVGRSGETLSGVVGLRAFLFLLTAIVMFCMWKYKQISRPLGYLFCFLYLIFIAFAVLGALGVIPV